MNFVVYGFLCAVFILSIFSSDIKFERHGEPCVTGKDKNCGFNCKCNSSHLCCCPKPKNLKSTELQYCYDNIQRVPHAVTTCYKYGKDPLLFCNYLCPEGLLENGRKKEVNQRGVFCKGNRTKPRSVPECYHNDCNDEIIVTKGRVTCSKSPVYEKICNISCMAGFTMVGDKTIMCRVPKGKSGWTGKKPLCLNSLCVDLMVKNKTITDAELTNCTVRSRDNNATCHITCKKDYFMEGNSVFRCDTLDNESLPICMKKRTRCEHLKEGDVRFKGTISNCSTTKDEDIYQDFCQYKCNSLYYSHREKGAYCRFSKGKWQFPECIFEPYNCEPVNVEGVKSTCSLDVGSIKNKTWYCTLECDEGYREDVKYYYELPEHLNHSKQSFAWRHEEISEEFEECGWHRRDSSLTCNYGNTWSGIPLKCLKNFDCEIPSDEGTTYKCTQKTFNKPFNCTALCNEGYHLKGPSVMKCQVDSFWDNYSVCKKNYHCEIAEVNEGNKCFIPHNFAYDRPWNCSFWCINNTEPDVGYEGVNYCQKDGWRKRPLRCQRKPL